MRRRPLRLASRHRRLPRTEVHLDSSSRPSARVSPVQVGMTLPVMEPDLDARVLHEWAAAVDTGPFSSLCFGERMAFDNPETLTLLGSVAAWTERVRLVTTVVVPQLHDPVMLAKSLATGDLLSNGRLTVGVGVGGREEDYRAVGVDLREQTMAEMARRVTVMRRVWSGEKVTEAMRPVGPSPVQPGGPPVLVGTMGQRTVRHAVGLGRRPRRGHPGSRPRRGRRPVRPGARVVGGGRQERAVAGDVVLLRAGRGRAGPRAGASAPAPLHELAARRTGRRDGPGDRVRRHRGGPGRDARTVRRDRVRRGAPDPDVVRRRAGAPGRRDVAHWRSELGRPQRAQRAWT